MWKAGAFLLAVFAAPALAADSAAASRQNTEAIVTTVAAFLERETRDLPGQVSVEVGNVDARLSLPACSHLHAFFPAGSRAWGQTSVGVRCAAPSAWTLYVPARVRITASYLVAARPLTIGQALSPEDLLVREGDLTRFPAGVLTDVSQALGRRLANSLQAGQPLRRDALREPPAVKQGQVVALYFQGSGFRITSEGRALGKAPEGELVQVRTASGTVVSGIVRPGPTVEIVR